MEFIDTNGFTEEHKTALNQLEERARKFSKTLVDVERIAFRLVGTGEAQWRMEVLVVASGMSQAFALYLLPEELKVACANTALADLLFEVCSDLIEHKAAIAFYKKNYDTVFKYKFDGGELCIPSGSGICRFCEKGAPEVSFDKIAHAIPQSTGNTGLYSKRECDQCNQQFGRTIEANFGDFTNWQRTLFRIGGKGIPSFVRKNSRIHVVDNDTEIVIGEDSSAQLKEDMSGLTIQMKNKGYTPAAVMFAFYKMAYTLMPDEELENFRHLRSWIKDQTFHKGAYYPLLPRL